MLAGVATNAAIAPRAATVRFPMRRLVKAFGGELPAGAVFITSDADTFPSRAQVAQLKYCRPAAQLPMLLQHQGYYFTLATAPKHERKYQIVAFTAADLEGPGCQSASTGAAAGLAGRCWALLANDDFTSCKLFEWMSLTWLDWLAGFAIMIILPHANFSNGWLGLAGYLAVLSLVH